MDTKRLRISAVIIGICVGVSVFLHLQQGDSVAAKLVATAKNLNARLPLNVDGETRWDTAVAGPGTCLTYGYTLVNAAKSGINLESFAAAQKSKLLLNYRTNPEMRLFRENHVTIRCLYKDKLGQDVVTIEASPNDL